MYKWKWIIDCFCDSFRSYVLVLLLRSRAFIPSSWRFSLWKMNQKWTTFVGAKPDFSGLYWSKDWVYFWYQNSSHRHVRWLEVQWLFFKPEMGLSDGPCAISIHPASDSGKFELAIFDGLARGTCPHYFSPPPFQVLGMFSIPPHIQHFPNVVSICYLILDKYLVNTSLYIYSIPLTGICLWKYKNIWRRRISSIFAQKMHDR